MAGKSVRKRVAAGGNRQNVTLTTIARATGVSQAAISSLLNDRDYGIRVSVATRQRVFKMGRDLGYIPNDLRAFLRVYPEHGETCVLVSTGIPGGFANSFVARVAQTLLVPTPPRNAGVSLAFYDEARDYAGGDGLPFPVNSGLATRLITIGAVNPSICALADHRSHPFIVIGHAAQIPGSVSIVPDYPAAARLAVDLLAQHGHRQLGIVGAPESNGDPRISEISHAITGAIAAAGLAIDARNIGRGNRGFHSGVDAVASMLGSPSSPTALLCLGEDAAAGVVAGARARGIAVPGGLSVVALRDHGGSLPSHDAITSVVLPADDIAIAALGEADRQLREGTPVSPQTIVIGVKIAEGATCGSPQM